MYPIKYKRKFQHGVFHIAALTAKSSVPYDSCEFIWHGFTHTHSVSQLQFVDVKSAGGLFFSSVTLTEGIDSEIQIE